VIEPPGHVVGGVAGDRVGQRGLAGAVGAHQGDGLALVEVEVDTAEDLGVVHLDRQVADLEVSHGRSRLVVWERGRWAPAGGVRAVVGERGVVGGGGDVDEDVVAVELHREGRDGLVRRQRGRRAGVEVEGGAVQAALDAVVPHHPVGERPLLVRAGVVDGLDRVAEAHEADRHAVDLDPRGVASSRSDSAATFSYAISGSPSRRRRRRR
jgi:hypothetical protein